MHLQLGEGQPSSEFGLSEGDTMKTTNPTVTDLYESSTITLIFNIRPEALLSAVSCNIPKTVVCEIKFSSDSTARALQCASSSPRPNTIFSILYYVSHTSSFITAVAAEVLLIHNNKIQQYKKRYKIHSPPLYFSFWTLASTAHVLARELYSTC